MMDREQRLRKELRKIERHRKALLLTEHILSFILLSLTSAVMIFIFTCVGYGVAHFVMCVEMKWVVILIHCVGGLLMSTFYYIGKWKESLQRKKKQLMKGEATDEHQND